jgi:hypothetical protein
MRGRKIWFVATRSRVTLRFSGWHVWAESESDAQNKVEHATDDEPLYAYTIPPSAENLSEADAFERANS